MLGVLLLAWAARVACLEQAPPGWRDDELIEIHVLAAEVLGGHFPLYFTGASGHEPLYHYLHAGLHAVLGTNVLSGHLLSAACGLLNVALTSVLARRLARSRAAALLAALGMALGFWALMYSRIGLRHIGTVTLALVFLYWLWRALERPQARLRDALAPGLALGAGLYTYFASRLLPLLLLAYGGYLLLFHRAVWRRSWRVLALTLVIGVGSAVPLALASGGLADARISELAGPLRELSTGNWRPLLTGAWETLAMFHASGDPEWLYNIAGRPLFNLPGAILMWGGVALCVWRWRQPRAALLLAWFWLGLAPAFVSIPPASFSHTIVAQPAVSMLAAMATLELQRWLAKPRSAGARWARARRALAALCLLALAAVWATNAVRDVRDYFVVWPRRGMVRYLYRADYRDAAGYLAAHPEVKDVAIGSALLGPWDRVALQVDAQGAQAAVRLFNPERALVWAGGGDTLMLLPSYPEPQAPLLDWLADAGACTGLATARVTTCLLPAPAELGGPVPELVQPDAVALAQWANGLELVGAAWAPPGAPAPGSERALLTLWRAGPALSLPRMPLIANPPPPGVYAGPRLAVFAHLVGNSSELVANDDGLWVDPQTLQPGDWFLQVHRFTLPDDAPAGPYSLELGLYDPMDGARVAISAAARPTSGDALRLPAGG
jgi:hypothetical protein